MPLSPVNTNICQNYIKFGLFEIGGMLYPLQPVIRVEEVPEQAGLLTVTKNGRKVITRKKAPVRNVEIPRKLFVYILMSRTEITSYAGMRRKPVEFWKEQLRESE